MYDILSELKQDAFSLNYAYESAVQNGFIGTEEDWCKYISDWPKNPAWNTKQSKLEWLTEADIDAMFDGVYESNATVELSFNVVDETLVI